MFDLTKIKNASLFNLSVQTYGSDLMQRQVELERWSNERGEMRFLKNAERLSATGRFAQTESGRCAVSAYYPPFRDALEWQLTRSQRGARAAWKTLLQGGGHLDSADIAMIALRQTLSLCARHRGDLEQQNLARQIMMAIKAEIVTREFARLEPLAVDDRMNKSSRKQASVEDIKRDVRAQMASRALTWEPDGFAHSGNVLAAGIALIQVLAQSCPNVIDISAPKYNGKKRHVYVSIHPELQDSLERREMSMASVAFAAMPLLVPPMDWSRDNLSQGGYYSTYIKNYPLVKKTRKLYALEVQNSEKIDGVCAAVNSMQHTGWRINTRVLDTLQWLFNHHEDLVDDFARSELPEQPSFSEAEWEQNKVECKRQLFEHYEEVRRLRSLRLQTLTLIEAAQMLSGEDRFYFAWDLDSRGRAYPITSNLSPQGSAWNRNLLQFAQGQEVRADEDMDGVRFAAANAMGHDKVPFAERIAWTRDNIDEIVAVGRDPQSNLLWTDADDPAAFLAAAIELADYQDQGLGFITRLPVAVDATCSGLQVLSALVRCETGGRMVNLTADPERYDIYSAVAEGPVTRKLQEIIAGKLGRFEGNELAQEFAAAALEYGFDRGLTKRVTMTVPYAAQEDSCRRYVREYYHKRLRKEGSPHESFHKFTVFMGQVVWDAIPEVVVKGLEVMRWLQQVSCAAIKANPKVPLQWETPDGFVGRTNRPKEKMLQPKVYIYDYTQRSAQDAPVTVLGLKTQQWLDEEDIRQHRNSCAPNFVHALDSTLLRMVVRRWAKICALQGRSAEFAMIHDSFAVGSADFRQFGTVIREEFVKIFERGDPLEAYERSMREIAGPDVVFPPRPENGSLDIREVLRSEYFFS